MSESNQADSVWLEGGCHCAGLRFAVRIPDGARLVRCSCSICRMKGILHLIVDAEDFVHTSDPNMLRTYQFGTGIARHHFCDRCGIHAWYVPRSHPDGIDVNVNCLDDPSAVDRLPVVDFDGRAWEASIGALHETLGDA